MSLLGGNPWGVKGGGGGGAMGKEGDSLATHTHAAPTHLTCACNDVQTILQIRDNDDEQAYLHVRTMLLTRAKH